MKKFFIPFVFFFVLAAGFVFATGANAVGITVTSPNGSEQWELGKSYTVTWQSSGYDKVNVSFSCENYGYGPNEVLASIGSYAFNILSSSPSQSQCKVFVDDSSVTNISQRIAGVNSDSSDNYFGIIPALSAPSLASPANNGITTTASLNFQWLAVANAKSYQYKIYDSFDKEILDWSTDWQTGSTMSVGTSIVSDGVYKWKVRACANLLSVSSPGDSTCSSWSETWALIKGSPTQLSAPTLTSPSNNAAVSKGSNSSATQTFVNLSWSSVVGANLYQYKIYNDNDQELYSYQVSSTSAGVGLDDNKTYAWKVRACNGTTANDSFCGSWSDVRIFTTSIGATLSAPTLLSPKNGITVSKGSNDSATQIFVTLSWTGVAGANLYQYKIYSSADQELYSYQTSSTNAGVGLDDGKAYKWKVRACNGTTVSDSTCGQWSQQWSFATASGLSVDLKINDSDNPSSVAYGAKIKVSWTSAGATKCIPMGHSIPVEGGQPWETGLYNLPLPGGVWTLYAQHSSFGYISPLEIGIQCFDVTGKSVADSINLSINPETKIGSAITVIYPNGGEKLKAGEWWPKITWKRNWTPEGANKKVSITVKKKDGAVIQFLAGGVMDEYGLESTIPTWLSTGDYKIIITSDGYGNNLSDESDNYFSIISDPAVSPTFATQAQELIKSPIDPTVYVIKDGKKQPIASPQEFEQSGYKWDQIKTVQSDLLKQISDLKAQISQLREELKKTGTLIKNPYGPEVYVIKDGKKEHITSPQEFSQKGYKWDQIQTVTSDEISQIPDFTPGQKEEGIYPNGTLIKAENTSTVYIIVNGKKRPIPDPATFNNWGLKWDQIKEVPSGTTADFLEITIPSDIVRAQGNDKIYRIIGDKKLWIPTTQAFLGSGYKPNSEIDISQDELSDFEDVKYIKAKGGTYVYEIKDDKKYRIIDTSQISAQDIKPVTLAEFVAYPIGK